jgi:hypothetical protein
MKSRLSLLACLLVSLVLLQHRMAYPGVNSGKALKVTTWDALGYYIYLPAIFIYHDIHQLNWFDSIDKKYDVSGGDFYQAQKLENGDHIFGYVGGVAVMESPFFFIGHIIAKNTNYPADGFSPPYQYSIAFGLLLYSIVAVFLLRKLLLIWFKDSAAAIALLLICLATNYMEYTAIESGMSHGYLFLLYVLALLATHRWHKRPTWGMAAIIGYIIGLATMSRPTELLMFMLPLLWNTHTKEAAKKKWALVKQHRIHILVAVLFGFLGVLPQLIYWKFATGSFIYEVGSKWDFLSPHFRVLFGWEKGWFIYTPITIFFVAGLFFIKDLPFRKSVIWFCLLNIYIVISWSDWRYGGSYSTRALIESYPVLALPFCALIERINLRRWGFAVAIATIYFIGVNLFQIWQYSKTILHYNDMNRLYYSHIYLNPHPAPLDMSLLDTDEFIKDEDNFQKKVLADTAVEIKCSVNSPCALARIPLTADKVTWLRIDCVIAAAAFWEAHLNCSLKDANTVKTTSIRLFNPLAIERNEELYSFYMKVPDNFRNGVLEVSVSTENSFEGKVEKLVVTRLEKHTGS